MAETQKTSTAGDHLFEDVFRRADKNDDGRLTQEEFFAYFKDDLLTKEDLATMFKDTDTDKSGTISLEELIAFFKKDFQSFTQLFSALEQVHVAVSNSLSTSFQSYQSQDFFQQFKTRFFLREFESQLLSLRRPVDVAIENLEKITATAHNRSLQFETHASGHQLSPQQNGDAGSKADALQHQVDRLAKLVASLESKPLLLEPTEEEVVDSSNEETLYMVSRKMEVKSEDIGEFEKLVKKYIRSVRKEGGAHHVYVKRIKDTTRCVLYEIWNSKAEYDAHLTGQVYKEHLKSNIDYLQKPEEVSTMDVPAGWFPNA